MEGQLAALSAGSGLVWEDLHPGVQEYLCWRLGLPSLYGGRYDEMPSALWVVFEFCCLKLVSGGDKEEMALRQALEGMAAKAVEFQEKLKTGWYD